MSSALIVGLAIFGEASFACDSVSLGTITGGACDCVVSGSVVAGVTRNTTTGAEAGSGAVTQCSNASDTVCSIATAGSTSTASPQYYKHSSGYYRCDWASGAGFSNGVLYTPGATVSAPIDLHFSKEVETFATDIELK